MAKKLTNQKVKTYYQNCHQNWNLIKSWKWKILGFPSYLYQIYRLYQTQKSLSKLALKDKIILDAACGDGYLLKFLPPNTVGIEIDPIQAQKARQKAPHTQVITGDIEKLPFSQNIFDAVISTEIFEHLPDPSLSINQLWRVLKKSGLFITTVPSNHPLWRFRSLASPMKSSGEPQCQTFTQAKLLSLFSPFKYQIILSQKIAFGLNRLLVLKKI